MPIPFWTYQHLTPAVAIVQMVRDGLSVIPINPANKKPRVPWKSFQTQRPSVEQAQDWAARFGDDLAIGLITGPINGWVAVDVDDPDQLPWVEATLPPTPIQQQTQRGTHLFYRQGEKTVPTKSNLGPDGKVDSRGRGGYIIIAPGTVGGHERHFQINGDPTPDEVSTLDDIADLDEFLGVRRENTQSHSSSGSAERVYDEQTGLVIDGREAYLRDIIRASQIDWSRTESDLPNPHFLARNAWDFFSQAADLSDGKWQFEDALEKSRYLLERIADGVLEAAPTSATERQPEPSAETLSPNDAIQKLNQTFSGFLDYREQAGFRPVEVRHLLIKSPAGLGKTTNAIELAALYIVQQSDISVLTGMNLSQGFPDFYPKWLFYVRTHNLANEIKRLAEEAFQRRDQQIEIPIWRGRSHDSENRNAPCLLWPQAAALADSGFPVSRNLCQRRTPGMTGFDECIFFQECEYISTRHKFAPFTVMMTAELPYLPLGRGGQSRKALIKNGASGTAEEILQEVVGAPVRIVSDIQTETVSAAAE